MQDGSSQITTWGVRSLGIEKLQKNNKTNSKIKIAIVDSGINVDHEDLKGKIVKEYNAINPDQPVLDDYGHGTAIAGIIASNDNQLGIQGIAANAEVYSVKFLDGYGKGSIESLTNAIEWCIENGVQIINVSFGMASDNANLRRIVNKALNSGIILVAAAGNNFGMPTDYPAAYEGVISVTAIDRQYHINKQFSSTGKIDFSLPGVNILTTTKDGHYAEYNGTSLASAHMTGIISLILENSDDFHINLKDKKLNEHVYKILKEKSINLGDENAYGNGFVKLY
ncbi:S8 family serine peptidase [Peribacillus simplex]|uniref:S8 family peptidase n=1 Tax=Peribacillus TaxID=2675229 RepID=UPI00315D7770